MPAIVFEFRNTQKSAAAVSSDRARLVEYLESATDLAFLKFKAAAKQYPGIEWDHITGPLKREWLDYEEALAMARCL